MSDSFMSKGLGESQKMPSSTSMRPQFTNRLYLPIGKGSQIVLLDGDSVNIYEHGIFITGDKTGMKLKVTCVSPGKDPVPGKCRICNAMIKDDRISRKFVSYLSCIDLSKFTIEGNTYTHTRKLVPLNAQAAKRLLRRQKEYGSLKGWMFKIFRNEKTSPTVGDDWEPVKRVNLIEYFKSSPRIKGLMEFYKKQGKNISPAEALKMLTSPFDYAKELEPTQQRIEYFLGYIGMSDKPITDAPEETDYDYSDGSATVSSDDEKDFDDFESFEAPEEEEEEEVKQPKKLLKHKSKFKKIKKTI